MCAGKVKATIRTDENNYSQNKETRLSILTHRINSFKQTIFSQCKTLSCSFRLEPLQGAHDLGPAHISGLSLDLLLISQSTPAPLDFSISYCVALLPSFLKIFHICFLCLEYSSLNSLTPINLSNLFPP